MNVSVSELGSRADSIMCTAALLTFTQHMPVELFSVLTTENVCRPCQISLGGVAGGGGGQNPPIPPQFEIRTLEKEIIYLK